MYLITKNRSLVPSAPGILGADGFEEWHPVASFLGLVWSSLQLLPQLRRDDDRFESHAARFLPEWYLPKFFKFERLQINWTLSAGHFVDKLSNATLHLVGGASRALILSLRGSRAERLLTLWDSYSSLLVLIIFASWHHLKLSLDEVSHKSSRGIKCAERYTPNELLQPQLH